MNNMNSLIMIDSKSQFCFHLFRVVVFQSCFPLHKCLFDIYKCISGEPARNINTLIIKTTRHLFRVGWLRFFDWKV